MHIAMRFCNIIRKAAKKTISGGHRNNCISYWDAECESLYRTFLQPPLENDSSLASTDFALIEFCKRVSQKKPFIEIYNLVKVRAKSA